MRCLSCNCQLTDYEATRKGLATGDYLDLCSPCLSTIEDEIEVIDRPDLRKTQDVTDDEFD